MTALRIYFQGERAGPLLKRATQRAGDRVREAARSAAQQAAEEIVERGRADIAAAPGNWGTRWLEGLQAKVSEGGGNIRIAVSHNVPYFGVFQHGAVIQGRPLLWIPLSFADSATMTWPGRGARARDYPGRLFRVDRKAGAPLLLDYRTKEPQYFGKESVTIPKKFHVLEIAREVARKLKEIFRENYDKQER